MLVRISAEGLLTQPVGGGDCVMQNELERCFRVENVTQCLVSDEITALLGSQFAQVGACGATCLAHVMLPCACLFSTSAHRYTYPSLRTNAAKRVMLCDLTSTGNQHKLLGMRMPHRAYLPPSWSLQIAPGYLAANGKPTSFMDHEYFKHGSCESHAMIRSLLSCHLEALPRGGPLVGIAGLTPLLKQS